MGIAMQMIGNYCNVQLGLGVYGEVYPLTSHDLNLRALRKGGNMNVIPCARKQLGLSFGANQRPLRLLFLVQGAWAAKAALG
jgi:hypothetical protein